MKLIDLSAKFEEAVQEGHDQKFVKVSRSLMLRSTLAESLRDISKLCSSDNVNAATEKVINYFNTHFDEIKSSSYDLTSSYDLITKDFEVDDGMILTSPFSQNQIERHQQAANNFSTVEQFCSISPLHT
jgi:hypothetical protein